MSRGSKNRKILNFLHWFFVHFFAICRELVKKISYLKKRRGHRPSKRIKSKQSYTTATIPSCEKISSFARALVHDVTWRCDMNCVRSKDARKQLARTSLRTFARKSSNIDFFIKLLLQLGYELLLSEMQKNWGVTDFVLEIRYLKGYPNFENGSNVCMSKSIANESLEQNFLCLFLYEWVC